MILFSSGIDEKKFPLLSFSNPSKSVKTVGLPGTYRDLDNQVYVGTVQLEPYSSIVLTAEKRDY